MLLLLLLLVVVVVVVMEGLYPNTCNCYLTVGWHREQNNLDNKLYWKVTLLTPHLSCRLGAGLTLIILSRERMNWWN